MPIICGGTAGGIITNVKKGKFTEDAAVRFRL